MKRRRARELALQALFQMDMTGDDAEKAVRDAVERDEEPVPEIQSYLGRLVRGVSAQREALDQEIAMRAREWKLERLAAVDRNVLRIGLFELYHCPDVPESVVANEAVELAKTFSTADSGRFVNGIIGAAIREGARGAAPPVEHPAG